MKKILTTKEVQEILQLNDRQARALMRTASFPSFRIGREWRIAEDALDAWIAKRPKIKLDYSKC